MRLDRYLKENPAGIGKETGGEVRKGTER